MNQPPRLSMRLVQDDDRDPILEWSNDPLSRTMSFSSEVISQPEHEAWFSWRMSNPDSLMLIATSSDGESMGLVKLIREDAGHAEIGITLDPRFRNQGLSVPILRASLEDVRRTWGDIEISAIIRTDNIVSRRIFEKVGFKEQRQGTYKDQACVYMAYTFT